MRAYVDSSFCMATDILFGKGTEAQTAVKIRQHGGTKVMLVYGSGSIKRSGLYNTVTDALNGAGIPFVELGGVQPNPRRSLAQQGFQLAQKEGVDFLLGVGGGSTIDTAKAIAMGLADGTGFWRYFQGEKPRTMAKVGTIHTISAAGSETSGSAVLVDDLETGLKKGMMYPDVLRPVFAIMNPELTYTVSARQTAAGASDIFSHSLERYFSVHSTFLADQFGAGLMRSVLKYAPAALARPGDYEARAELMLAASFAHNGVTGIGKPDEMLMIHGLEAYISGTYDTPHGQGLAVLMPAWLQFIAERCDAEKAARAAQFAVDVFGVQPDMQDVRATAMEGVRRFRAWNKAIGMPASLTEMGIPAADLKKLVDNSRYGADGVMRGYIALDKKDVETIFQSILL